jgi:hypothetical protein
MPAFPETRIGTPIQHESLTVYPLFTETSASVQYLLGDEAIASGNVTVNEMNEGGSVPELLVDNQADAFVLFLEGEELKGAKQNRVLNTTVLLAAKSKTKIPVSCVEQGRWRYISRYFASAGRHSSPKLRKILKMSVSASAAAGSGHVSDQGEVWKEVGRQSRFFKTPSPTGAMGDTYEAQMPKLNDFRERLKYVEGAAGLAVAVGGKVVSIDVFDKPATCQKVWDRLLTGMVMDSLETPAAADQIDGDLVQQQLAALRQAAWQSSPPVGVGEEFRAELDKDRHASALTCEGNMVHGSLVCAG